MRELDDIIPASVAIDNRVVPIREIGKTLVLATDESVLPETRERIAFILNRNLRFVVRSHDWIDAELELRYRFPVDDTAHADESDSVCWYWPDWHYVDGDKLVVKTSGWEGMTHWTGAHEFSTDHPDRDFWDWLVEIPQYHGLLDEREIPKIRRVWNRYRQRVGDRRTMR